MIAILPAPLGIFVAHPREAWGQGLHTCGATGAAHKHAIIAVTKHECECPARESAGRFELTSIVPHCQAERSRHVQHTHGWAGLNPDMSAAATSRPDHCNQSINPCLEAHDMGGGTL